MNPRNPIVIIAMILLALGNTIYAVVEYFHNEGGIAQIVSGILFVITFLVVSELAILFKLFNDYTYLVIKSTFHIF